MYDMVFLPACVAVGKYRIVTRRLRFLGWISGTAKCLCVQGGTLVCPYPNLGSGKGTDRRVRVGFT